MIQHREDFFGRSIGKFRIDQFNSVMTENYKSMLYKKYNVVGHLEFKQFDHDFLSLEEYLQQRRKDTFDLFDRFIIEHVDTDYYIDGFPYGFNLYNLFTAFKKVDIPLFTMLLFTNNFGIEEEVKELIEDYNDFPTIIYSFVTKTHCGSHYSHRDIDTSSITMPAVCMLGKPRSHRNALYRYFEDQNLLDRVAVSLRSKHE